MRFAAKAGLFTIRLLPHLKERHFQLPLGDEVPHPGNELTVARLLQFLPSQQKLT